GRTGPASWGPADSDLSDVRHAAAVSPQSRRRRREVPSRAVGLLRVCRGVRYVPVPAADEEAAESLNRAPAALRVRSTRLGDRDERVHEVAVAPALSCFVRQHLKRLVGETRGAVRAYGRQRVEDVDDADDLREQRHFAVPQTVRVAGAVESLVMMANDRPDLVERSQSGAE